MDARAPEDIADLAVIEVIRARGPVWIPADEAWRMMDEIIAEAEDAAHKSLTDHPSA